MPESPLLSHVFTEENFQKVVEYAPIGIVIIDGDLKWRLVNKKFCEITGFTKEEILHKTFIDITHPEDVKLNMNLYLKLLSGEVNEYEYEKRYVRKDNRVIWVRLNVSAVRIQGEYSHMIALVQDVDDNKRYRHQLEMKNKELDTLFYKASHDLKAPVTTLEGLCNLLKIEQPDLQTNDSFVHLGQTVERLKLQNEALLQLTRINEWELKIQTLMLDKLISSVCERAGLPVKSVLIEAVGAKIKADADLLEVVLKNLLSNAVLHAHPGRELQIKIKVEVSDTANRITITDNGVGMEEEVKERAFDMFFKGSGETGGSGLGLYIVRKAIDKLNGEISLQSLPQMGSTFTIFLPAN